MKAVKSIVISAVRAMNSLTTTIGLYIERTSMHILRCASEMAFIRIYSNNNIKRSFNNGRFFFN